MVTGKGHRRVVTGHRGGKSVVLSDQRREPYKFKTVAGFEHTYIWSTNGSFEANPDKVDQELPRSALPPADGSLLPYRDLSACKDRRFVNLGSFAGGAGIPDTLARTRGHVRARRIANARNTNCGLRDNAGRRAVAGTRRRRDGASFPARHCRPAGDAPWLAQQGRTAGDDGFRHAGARTGLVRGATIVSNAR